MESNGMAGTSNPGASSTSLATNFTQSIEGCLESTIHEYGLSDTQLRVYLEKAKKELQTLKQEFIDKSLPLLSICSERSDIEDAAQALQSLSTNADLIIFFGTGGSSLGGQALAQMSGWNLPGVGEQREQGRPRTRFYDNLDPNTLERALSKIDLEKTRFIVTSKSGGTTETLAQTIVALEQVKAAGLAQEIPNLFLGITQPKKPGTKNGLRALFEHLNIPMLDHHTGIGGRFSCLTNVGLIVALSRGMDAHLIRHGAKDIIDQMMAIDDPRLFSPTLGAAVAMALNEHKGICTSVMMPYTDRLGRLAHWYAQLWAESLGKNGKGTSPIAALGPLDQHSQLQLFMDGPRHHLITIIRLDTTQSGPHIDPEMAKIAGQDFLIGRTVGDIVNAQANALPKALAKAGRPVRTIDLHRLDERTIGALFMHFMLETIISGRILGIDPFDQPAVELAKVLTRDYLAQR